jgi:D-alanyl-D-alanine carboxypeptidase (penicillin-binding protein 5/6)
MKNKILIVIIIFLFVGIIVVKYNNFKLTRPQPVVLSENDKAQIKGIQSDFKKIELPEIKNIEIVKTPTKIKDSNEPDVYAKSYILTERDSNYVLAEKDSHERMPIASTTKIMTAVIALENYKLDDVISISSNAAAQIGSDVYLQSNEQMTVKNVLYALIVRSGNDAAMALAEHMEGGYEVFIKKMNEKATLLGMNDTEYKDPAGLDDTGYSTAADLAIVTSYALNNNVFRELIKTKEITITSIDNITSHSLVTSNRLIDGNELFYYPLAIGVKTGYTPEAGHCLVSAAENNGFNLIGVVLNTSESTNDASAKESKKLLEWGYNNFEF